MPRYFFDVHDGLSLLDDEGTELGDLACARHEAVRLAGALLVETSVAFWSGEAWAMEVRDDTDAVLFTLTFCASEGCRPAAAA